MPENYIRNWVRLDFFIPEIQFNIEFDGVFWHDVNNKLKIDDDNERDVYLKKIIPRLRILRIKEMYYIKHRDSCVSHIVNIIKKIKEVYNG